MNFFFVIHLEMEFSLEASLSTWAMALTPLTIALSCFLTVASVDLYLASS